MQDMVSILILHFLFLYMNIMNAKQAKYQRLYNQIKELTNPVYDPISRMATISAVLHHKMKGYFWTGFYLLEQGELLVGPYQGPLACLRLKKDTGVCWAGINQQKTIIVDDVEAFTGHIACSSLSKSEIVVPVFNNDDKVIGVLDVDSRELANFNEEDKKGLEKIVELIFE
jgi:GAF domain-containing protein